LVDREYLNNLLNDKKKLLTQVYFELQEYFEKLYGKKTVVFIEIGSFFEVYEVQEPKPIGKAKEIAEFLNIQLTKKNKSILEVSVSNPLMAGVPSVALDRYLSRLVQNGGYTVVLIRQKGQPPKVQRYLANVISPGTNFEFVGKPSENYLASIILGETQGRYFAGFSAVDVTTGKCFVNEVYSTKEDKTFALDEIFNTLQSYEISEIILTFDTNLDKEFIHKYLELDHYAINQNQHRPKINYQNELFKKIFSIHSILSPIEYLNLERYPFASESLAILCDFIIEHDPALVEKLQKPLFLNSNRFVYLGNNALEQLGVISKDPEEMTLLKLLDHTSTPMGKRLLRERLLNPIQEKEELERRYSYIQLFLNRFQEFSALLKQIYDVERIFRRIKLKKAHPFEINYLHSSLYALEKILEKMKKGKVKLIKLQEVINFRKELQNRFNLEECAKYRQDQIDSNIFCEGVIAEIDLLEKEIKSKLKTLEQIKSHIGKFLENPEYIQIGWLESEGFYLTLTKNRFTSIQKELLNSSLTIDNTTLYFKEFNYKKLKNSVKITSSFIDKLSDEYLLLKTKLIAKVKKSFEEELEQIELNFSALLEQIIAFIAELDVAISGAKVAVKYNYVKPEIVEDNILEFVALRHPIIESREENGIFVPNDLFFGDGKLSSFKDHVTLEQAKEVKGILLYGINSSGKSSLMKSVGLALIMAQAGFFVPATTMRYGLRDKIFTRIVSKDNLYKGLSTFAVEMLELKNIFNRASERSVVLGDEVSQGTETYSALSIVTAAIKRLDEFGAFFIFATHLHQLVDMPKVKELKRVIALHLGVRYDEKSDKLIYDRKLKVGSGSTMYGLEFAKALHMDKKFLEYAMEVRKELTNQESELELLKKRRKSRYNRSLFLTKCAICNEVVEEVHHIAPKAKAKNGYIDHFKANHRYNLIPLCSKHHKMVHEGKLHINGFFMSEEGLTLHYTLKEE